MRFLATAFSATFVGVMIAACSGGQGDECTTDSDCKTNLTCQPVEGRDKNYCCPTPATQSDYANCHPDQQAIAAKKNTQQQAGADAGGH
jgi:hypothetical protein